MNLDQYSAFLKDKRKNDLEAQKAAISLIGSSIVDNAKWLPFMYMYLYQVGNLGSMMNTGLRTGKLTRCLYQMYFELMTYFKHCQPIGQNVTLFRGIPKTDLPKINIGDIITESAFMSTSLDPNVSLFFGDQIFMIQLRLEDKLLYINGSDAFFPDTFECILPPGTSYRVVDIYSSQIDNQDVTIYSVQSLGCISSNKWNSIPISIDDIWDRKYASMIETITAGLKDNFDEVGNLCKINTSLVYYGEIDGELSHWSYGCIPNGIPESREKFFIQFMKTADPTTLTVLTTVDLYIQMLKKQIKALYIVPHSQIRTLESKRLPTEYNSILCV